LIFLIFCLTPLVCSVSLGSMKLYPNVNVELTYQNFGSSWIGVLRGTTQAIELVFNGLYNLCATNGGLDYHDNMQTVGFFWTDKKAMRRFFFNQYYLPKYDGQESESLKALASQFAECKLKELSETSHENFMQFARKGIVLDCFNCGCITAEKPDVDMKDAIISHAYSDKSVDNG